MPARFRVQKSEAISQYSPVSLSEGYISRIFAADDWIEN